MPPSSSVTDPAVTAGRRARPRQRFDVGRRRARKQAIHRLACLTDGRLGHDGFTMPSQTSPINGPPGPVARPSVRPRSMSAARWRPRRPEAVRQRVRLTVCSTADGVFRKASVPTTGRPCFEARAATSDRVVRLRQGDPAPRFPTLARGRFASWWWRPAGANGIQRTATFRLVVTRGPGDLGIDPP